jgi:hypothetical protein
MMHYKRFDEFDRSGRLGVPLVRLVIPVTLVAEIDNKKYARPASSGIRHVTCWPSLTLTQKARWTATRRYASA